MSAIHNPEGIHPAIKLRHIRAFLAIAAEGSLSAVARAQGITQPGLSRTLAELEDLLGQPLFHRQGRRLALTEAGLLFRRHAGEGLRAFEAGALALRPGAPRGHLRVGVLPTVATRLFPSVALRFHAARPDTVLTLLTGPHSHLIRLLRDRDADLMVGRMPAAAEIAGLSFTHLYDEEVVLALRAGHPLAHLSPAELVTRVPMILPPDGAIIRRGVEDWIASLGLSALSPAFETVALAVGRGLVTGSEAGWLISRGVILDELERGQMIALPVGAGALSGPVGLTRRQDGAADGTLALLLRIAQETVETTLPGAARPG